MLKGKVHKVEYLVKKKKEYLVSGISKWNGFEYLYTHETYIYTVLRYMSPNKNPIKFNLLAPN